METKAPQTRNVIFWSLIGFFAALVVSGANRWRFWGHRLPPWGFAIISIAFCTLAVVLVVLTAKLKEPGLRKWFFIVTGASAAAISICAVLHNVVYRLFFYGKDGDEAVFFILALLVFPALFILGALGSIVLLIRTRLRKKES